MSRELLQEAHFVMDAAIKDWEVPDSPEAFIISMKGLMVM